MEILRLPWGMRRARDAASQCGCQSRARDTAMSSGGSLRSRRESESARHRS